MFHLYFILPKIFKKRILKRILKMEGGEMYSPTIRSIFEKKYGIEIGYGTYGGCFNTTNNIPKNVRFGNWCSIAKNIRIFRANHPKGEFTSHPLMYNPLAGYVEKDMLIRPPLNIGHDVWIGEWVIILPNVKKIGNGAIIGAGSIVTKDIEPYSIVAGNPAKKIGSRFNEEIIIEIEKSKWWEMDKDELIKNVEILNEVVNKRFN